MRSGGRGAIRRSKLRRVITAPFRMITNAGNFYVRSMEGLAGRVESVGGGGGGGVGGPAISVPPTLPKSFSVRSSSTESDQEGQELVRSVSRRGNGGGGVGVGMGMRSYSVGVGKIGRIDEDEPCEFEEDKLRSGGVNNNNKKKKKGGVDLGLYYSRSKSHHAIGQRNFVHVNVNHTTTTTTTTSNNNNNNVGFVY